MVFYRYRTVKVVLYAPLRLSVPYSELATASVKLQFSVKRLAD